MNDQSQPSGQPESTPDNSTALPESSPYSQYSANPAEQQGYAASPADYSQSGYQQPDYAPAGYPQGAPQAGAYYQQPEQYPYPPAPLQRPTDGLAIASLVTGVLGLALIPLILGLISLNKIKKTGAQGRGMAIAGVVLGALGTVGYTLLFILLGIGVFAAMNSDSINTSTGTSSSTSSTTNWATVEEQLADNPDLQPLYDDCAAGDMAACDSLYLDSDLFSPLEEFADNCGGKGRDGLLCDG